MKAKQSWLVVAALIVALIGLAIDGDECAEAWVKYGISVGVCPVGEVRQTAELEVRSVRRGAEGRVVLRATAHYTTGPADGAQTAPVSAPRVTSLALVDAKQRATPIPVAAWTRAGASVQAAITLPEVPDGDYQLRATYETRAGAGELSLALPLYTPARIHVITDRPLYEPGNTVRFRAVALRARDLAPLDHRPGAWVVTDPNGDVVLEEQAPAGEWGVISGSFPLDRGAPVGGWSVAWRSAEASDTVTFTVQPFTLPRFRVEAAADATFYRPAEAPVIRGAILYSSGAPVAGAALDVQWDIQGAWPPPREWLETLLPKRATAGANGRFELALPKVPADLQGTATITARIAAVDPAGDRAVGAASVLLSETGILASAVTELADGLIEGFNNRLYLRVTTPDGREVANAKLTVRRAWQPNDNGLEARSDEDGVASLQLDPGAPVNVVIPAQPYRPAPRPPLVTRGEARELIGGDGAPLADQVELDRWLPALAPCAKWFTEDGAGATLGLRVDRSGALAMVTAGPGALARCAANVVRQRRLPPGGERMYALALTFTEPELPSLEVSYESPSDWPDALAERLPELARGARDCLPAEASGRLPRALSWRVRAGGKAVELGPWLDDPGGDPDARAAVACVTGRIAGAIVTLPEPAEADAMGLVRFDVEQPASVTEARPQPTTMLGYELRVTADLPGNPATTLRLAAGTVPRLRLRVSSILAQPGETIIAQLLRGPDFTGALPKQLELRHRKGTVKVDVDAERLAVATIPPGTEGWVELAGGGVRALVYVKPPGDLAVAIKPKQDRYRPRDQAELEIQTRIGGRGGRAAVGLFGVDESLAQLVPLPGAGDLARVQPRVVSSAPAFGALDGQALALGRIRGANAAAATVLRVTEIPRPAELDAQLSRRVASGFDPIEELTDSFYRVLGELHAQARQWEARAARDEKMRPATMAALWQQALAACARRGERVVDAYGRRLALSLLPPDLLALTDPRAVIASGTRLPEDVENWAAWVAKEKP